MDTLQYLNLRLLVRLLIILLFIVSLLTYGKGINVKSLVYYETEGKLINFGMWDSPFFYNCKLILPTVEKVCSSVGKKLLEHRFIS